MMLLLDIGNTKLKWAWLAGAAPVTQGAVLHAHREPPQWLDELPSAEVPPERILAANVAGSAVAHAIDAWSHARFGRHAEFPVATRTAGGVTNAYIQPGTLGIDRWLAMIGAWQRAHRPLVCLAAGTAMTVDAIDGSGRHLGGWILPGRQMMRDSLRQGTAELARSAELAPPVRAGDFGVNTAGAIEAGCLVALAASADRAARLLGLVSGQPPAVFVAGGDALEIAGYLETPATPAPDLVFEGLAVLAHCA